MVKKMTGNISNNPPTGGHLHGTTGHEPPPPSKGGSPAYPSLSELSADQQKDVVTATKAWAAFCAHPMNLEHVVALNNALQTLENDKIPGVDTLNSCIQACFHGASPNLYEGLDGTWIHYVLYGK